MNCGVLLASMKSNGCEDKVQSADISKPTALILTKYGELGASSRIRLFQFVPEFSKFLDVKVQYLLSDRYIQALGAGSSGFRALRAICGIIRRNLFLIAQLVTRRRYDFVIVEQELVPLLPTRMEKFILRQLSRGVLIVDVDDGNHLRYEGIRGFRGRLCGGKFQEIWRMADHVVCGSGQLVEDVLAAGVKREKIELIPSVPPPAVTQWVRNEGRGESIVIGWIGSPTTAEDLGLVWKPLKHVAREFPIEVHVMGAEVAPVSGLTIQCLPWSSSAESELLRRIDIGIMPLEDSEFKRRKCGFKLINYMSVGIPVIASDVGGNRSIISDKELSAGFVCSSDTEWLLALRRFLGERELRRRFGAEARLIAQRRFSFPIAQAQWRSLVRDLSITDEKSGFR